MRCVAVRQPTGRNTAATSARTHPATWEAAAIVGAATAPAGRCSSRRGAPALNGPIPPDQPEHADGMSEAQLEIVPGESPGNYILRGEIDLHTASQIAEISTRRNGTIILDFADVTFIDSIGVWAIVNLVRGPDGGTLVIRNPSGNVKRTFDLVGIRDAPGIIVE